MARLAERDYSLVGKLQGLTLDLTVQTHDSFIHERALRREGSAVLSGCHLYPSVPRVIPQGSQQRNEQLWPRLGRREEPLPFTPSPN